MKPKNWRFAPGIFSKKNKPKKIYTAGSSSFYERITPKFISPSKRIPLTKQNYFAAFDTLGRVKDPVGLKNKIFEGSISEEIRDSVWEVHMKLLNNSQIFLVFTWGSFLVQYI